MTDVHHERPQRARPQSSKGPQQVRLGAIVALLAVIGVVIWLLVRGGSSSPPASTTSNSISATAVSVGGLRTISLGLQQPIFWVGTRPSVTYELSQTNNGTRTYVRYLPKGVAVGSSHPYLTVGTYSFAGAYAATAAVAARPGSVRVPVGADEVAFYSTAHPENVYAAFKSSNYQIEVFSPVPGQARALVAGKQLSAVTGVTGMGPVATTAAGLTTVGHDLGHPVYWLGTKAHDTYELTEEPDGRVYLRYLPHGVALGSATLYLTVGTYPMDDAYRITAQAADQPGTTKIHVPGAIAFYSPSRPDSVYVAFKGAKAQIEVYDPSPATARSLVAAGKLAPLG